MLFLFPAAWPRILFYLREAAALVIIIYPVYNGIKRAKRAGDLFAVSSYGNNVSEWIMGIFLGTCIGLTLAACFPERTRSLPHWAYYTRLIAAALQGIMITTAIALYCSTWDTPSSLADPAHPNHAGRVFVVLLPACIFVAAVFWRIYWHVSAPAPPGVFSVA